VIGATGFVGSALVPELERQGEVIAVSRRDSAPDVPGVRALAADVTDSLQPSSFWLHLGTPVRADVARPLIEGRRNPTVACDDRIRRLLPLPLTGFCDAGCRALDPVTADRARGRRLTVPPRRSAQLGAGGVPTRSRGDRS
jgi:hypothetical protein